MNKNDCIAKILLYGIIDLCKMPVNDSLDTLQKDLDVKLGEK
jgi:hypothetical protein